MRVDLFLAVLLVGLIYGGLIAYMLCTVHCPLHDREANKTSKTPGPGLS